MKKLALIFSLPWLIFSLAAAREDATLAAMGAELARSYPVLSRQKPVPLYFLQYEITDEHQVTIAASLGALSDDSEERHRYLDVDVRVGSYKLDNTHEIRGGGDYMDWIPSIIEVPVDDDAKSLRSIIWAETDRKFKSAQERYIKVQNERQVKVLETDTSPDFSRAHAAFYAEEAKIIDLDRQLWADRVRRLSSRFRQYPWIYESQVLLRANLTTKYLVNSDGTKLKHSYVRYNIRIYASTMADDGMVLYLSEPYMTADPGRLPGEQELAEQADSIVNNLMALRNAPLVEPYSGPAILMNRACGVFFHEIFGHRIEGHRQKSESEGQTFTKKVNEKILPDFISISDDPTMKTFNGRDLNGYFLYDDEGVKAQEAVVVKDGILKGFLMSRSPIAGFPASNGHGRRQYGRDQVSRQGVLYIRSKKEIPIADMRDALVDECRKQSKPYGLIFYDISGGFTMMGRNEPQTFKVIPLLVKRVYVDGRPDEVVRGVDIVGTPLLSFSKIVLTGDDYGIFNGTCGAESGWVPVSAIAPSILVSEIEVEKKAKGQDRPPILPAPADQPR
jgi:predicted Zn-dependent protease